VGEVEKRGRSHQCSYPEIFPQVIAADSNLRILGKNQKPEPGADGSRL
jgi:hypothetical protein